MTTLKAVAGSPRPIRQPRPLTPYSVGDGAPVEVVEDGPSIAGRLAWVAARVTIRPTLAIISHIPHLPWPWGVLDVAARTLVPHVGSIRATTALPHCTAQLVRAKGVLPADGAHRIVLYMHGGAFLTCGPHTHGRLTTMVSQYADSPVLVPNYRKIPKHTVGDAIEDCHDGWRWLREHGYQPEQIVLAGDSAGSYLALTLAERLLRQGEEPAALVLISPLMQLEFGPKQSHPNNTRDAMFPPKAFEALVKLIEKAAAGRITDGEPEGVYEPLDHVSPGLPPTLIHVSGSEVLLYDARLAIRRLAAVSVPAELRIWPGQMHVFQLCVPVVPEATRSLRQIGNYIKQATA